MRETMNIVVITGASSGMGREFAMQLDRGLHSVDEFWLIARRGSRLKEIASGMQHTVKILPLDLTNEADMTVLTESLAEEKPVVRMLINCAGYGMMGDFTAVPIKEQTGEVDLNCRALLEVTYGVCPICGPGAGSFSWRAVRHFCPSRDFQSTRRQNRSF